jgi:hypothetical protein
VIGGPGGGSASPVSLTPLDELPLFFSQLRFHPFGNPLQISVDARYVDIPSGRQHFGQELRGQAVRDQGSKLAFQVGQLGRRSLRQ